MELKLSLAAPGRTTAKRGDSIRWHLNWRSKGALLTFRCPISLARSHRWQLCGTGPVRERRVSAARNFITEGI